MSATDLIDRQGDPALFALSAREAAIYLDHHATTPVDPRVAEVVTSALTGTFGNPHATENSYGAAAADLLTRARERVAAFVDAVPDDVRFTSGATEAIRLAVAHATAQQRGRPFRIAVARLEHRAVLDAVRQAALEHNAEVVWLEVDCHGRLQRDSVTDALRSGIELICLMAANNEVGTVYPVEEVAAEARAHDAAILVDATQAAGLRALRVADWGLDYVVLSSHKLYGPKGAGALVTTTSPDGWESILWARPGTPNVPGIAGFAEACSIAAHERATDARRIATLRDRLEAQLTGAIPGVVVNGARENRLENNLHIAIADAPSDAVIARLRGKVAISSGSACTSGSHQPSHVLQAMHLPDALQGGALRIGLGRFTTPAEIDRAAEDITNAITAVRNAMFRG